MPHEKHNKRTFMGMGYERSMDSSALVVWEAESGTSLVEVWRGPDLERSLVLWWPKE
jgi:hypothetical protein